MTLTPDVSVRNDALDAMLADPEIRESLAVIVANAPTLAALAAMGTGLLQRGPELADNVNQIVAQLRTDADTGDGRASQLRIAVGALAAAGAHRRDPGHAQGDHPGLPRLGHPPARDRRRSSAPSARPPCEADKQTRGKQVQVGSIFALNKVLKEPEVQETLAFFVEFARVFGKHQRAGS